MLPRGLLHTARARLAPALAIVIVALTSPLAARADVPPDPDSANAHCTPKEQCPSGVYCPYAFRPGAKPNPGEVPVGEACRNDATSKGLERRCRKGGNYGGEELFCPAGEAGSWSPPGKPSSSRCSVTAAGGPAISLPLALILAPAALICLRRRARRRRVA